MLIGAARFVCVCECVCCEVDSKVFCTFLRYILLSLLLSFLIDSSVTSLLWRTSHVCVMAPAAAAAGGVVDKVLLRGLVFRGFHGVLAAENELGQQFRVDLALTACLRKASQQHTSSGGGSEASLADTVDYAAVYSLVKTHVERVPPLQLLEQLAGGICRDILETQPRVEQVQCRILKPHVAVPGIVTEGLGKSKKHCIHKQSISHYICDNHHSKSCTATHSRQVK